MRIVMTKQEVPTTKLAITVNGKPIYDGPNPLKFDRYSFVPIMGYHTPDISSFNWRWSGVVRTLRDSQFLYNRRKVIELEILESQINSGFKYKPSSLVNPNDIHLSGQGKGLAMKAGADMNDVQEIQPAQVPASMIQLSELLGRELMEISGVNEELLGAAQDDKAGVLAMLRQGAGLVTLQKLFDGLDFSQKMLGELYWLGIQKNYSLGKIRRILGEEPSEEFKTGVFLNQDIRIEEGVNTTTQRQLEFAQNIHLRELGVPISDARLVKSATVQNKEELVQELEQQAQAAQQQQQMEMQAQMKLLQAQVEELEARATANTGLGIERVSRLEENKLLAEERRAQAVENISDARLNRAKTLAELQDIDINQIHRLLEIAQLLQTTESEKQEVEQMRY